MQVAGFLFRWCKGNGPIVSRLSPRDVKDRLFDLTVRLRRQKVGGRRSGGHVDLIYRGELVVSSWGRWREKIKGKRHRQRPHKSWKGTVDEARERQAL